MGLAKKVYWSLVNILTFYSFYTAISTLKSKWIAISTLNATGWVGGASKLLSLFQILQIVDILSIYMYHILSMGMFTCY